MDYKSHLTGGAAIGIGSIYLSQKLQIDVSALYVLAGALAGSLIPDIDHPKSYLGNRIPLIPSLLYSTVGHRTLTHSLIFAFAIGILLSSFNISLGVGIFLGIISHIFLDMLTPQGVSYLYPFRKQRIKWFRF